jgi:hypothetical protein
MLMLPETEVIDGMKVPYSTYLRFPLEIVKNMRQISKNASVSITDILCASVTLTLKKVAEHCNHKTYFNIIRSVRNNEVDDKMIGCFLRLDPIKVDMKSSLRFIELAKVIQQSRLDTEPYQACSGMVKLACLSKTFHKKYVKNFMTHFFSTIYCVLFRKSKLNPMMLKMYWRLKSLRTKQQFLVNINILNHFVSPTYDKTLFGLKLNKTKTCRYDLSNIDNVLDICLLRNNSQNKAYLVISGNLKPSFRKKIGNEIIKILSGTYQE